MGCGGVPFLSKGGILAASSGWRVPWESGVAGQLICAHSAGMWMCWL